MAAAGCEVILRQRICLTCGKLFWICRHCDRGQRYCSASCRHQAYCQKRRLANPVISKVPRDDSIIETVSGRIVGAVWSRRKA
jgi:hypothetical protein